MNHDFCLRLGNKADAEEYRRQVNDILRPEYCFADNWKPCLALITSTKRQGQEIYFLHPLFIASGCGVIVPPSAPIRVQHTRDQFLLGFIDRLRPVYLHFEILCPKKTAAHHKKPRAVKGGGK